MSEPTSHELARQIQEQACQIELLEEKMNTKRAEYESAIDRLRADMAQRDARMADRDRDNMRWFVGISAIILLGILGILIRLFMVG